MKPLPEHADPQYIASMIVLHQPVEAWKDKIATLPEDKREAVREILLTYYQLAKGKGK